MASSQITRETAHLVPFGVFSAAMHEFAVHLYNVQIQVQGLGAENVQLQIKVAALLEQISEMQASRDLQEQVLKTQADLIRALESEQRGYSPLLQSPTVCLPQPLSPILESNRSTPACMTEPTVCDVADVSILAQYGEEPSSPETAKRPANDDATGTAKRRAPVENWPLPG
ncbi:hypothetical protein PG991_009234 [Apiospora marii]|uniref:Uncharacterized protein n=1 Tax=Apiospora marii TaxID=335849 RepID=A0ABR1RLD5_9PEZI